jgi:recombination protein RecT
MTEVAQRDDRPPLVVLRQRLQDRKDELRHALTDVTPDQFIRAVTTSAQVNPDIQACAWPSLWNACLRACRDNLLPDGVEGAIVPYGDKAQWIPMYLGLLRRFRRSGQFLAVMADCVRDGDTFRHYVDETGVHLFHEPAGDFAAPIVRVYALAQTKDGGKFVAVLPIAEVDKIRKMSRTKRDDSPWNLWFEEMAKKTALRRLSKYLPAGRDLDLPDDDDDLADYAPSPAPPRPIRAPGAAAALDKFAASGEPASVTPAGEPDAAPAAVEHSATAESAANDRAPDAAPDDQAAAARKAYERGQAAKAGGMIQRRAVPGEYRDNTRLALAWVAGYDSSPMPTFAQTED